MNLSATTEASAAASASNLTGQEPTLSWARRDLEQRLGFRGARFTRVNNLLSFLLAGVATVGFYLLLLPIAETPLAAMFTERGPTPYFIAFFSCWSLAILLLKWGKLKLQRQALAHRVVPDDPTFVLSPSTADDVMHRIYATVDDPRHFLLFNRIVIALSNLRNLGRVSDVDEILRSQAEHDESSVETSYALLKGFIWAIPVLGFIGTVLGLSQAIGGFGSVLGNSQDLSQIAASLKGVTAGLATAFETTLAALVAALAIQMLFTFLKKSEEEFLDECAEYCHRHVVNRLRLMPFESQDAQHVAS